MKLAIDSLQREIDAINARIKRDEAAISEAEFHLKCHRSGQAEALRSVRQLELAIAALQDA